MSGALAATGVSLEDDGVMAELNANIAVALEEGVIDDAVAAAAGEADAADSQPFDDALRGILVQQRSIWADVAEEWRDAFSAVRDEFQACTETVADSNSECALAMKNSIQAAHAAAWGHKLPQKLAEAKALSAHKREAALAELESEQSRSMPN